MFIWRFTMLLTKAFAVAGLATAPDTVSPVAMNGAKVSADAHAVQSGPVIGDDGQGWFGIVAM